jgi:hypothetical protein
MTRSKRIFFIVAAIFLLLVVLVCIDIARRTTFPGPKKDRQEQINEQ